MDDKLTRCPRCGSDDLETAQVEELVAADRFVVRFRALAEVCHRCGERYLRPDTVRQMEEIHARLRRGDLSGLRSAGEVLEPAA
jgi:uncharacterized protein with PIN domain